MYYISAFLDSTSVYSVVDSRASETGVSSDSSLSTTTELPVSCSSIVDFVQQFVKTTYSPVFKKNYLTNCLATYPLF